MRNWKTILAGLALFTGIACAQQEPKPDEKQNPADVNAQPGPSETAPEPRSIFGESMASRFTIATSANFQEQYDDNVFSSGAVRVTDWVSRFDGRITATMLRKHGQFQLHYLPGYVLYKVFSNQNSYNQQGIVTWDQQFTAATGLRLSGTVSDFSNASLPSYTLVQQGNTFVPVFAPGGLQTNTRDLTSNTSLTLTHSFSPKTRTWVAIDGGTSSFRNEFATGVTPLLASDTYVVGGTIGWMRVVSPGRSFGFDLAHRYFGFLSPSSHTNYSYAKLRFEQKVQQTYTFYVGAGPSVSTVIGQDPKPNYAVDAGVTHQSKRMTIGVNFAHETSLSNFQGALGSDTASASLSYRGPRRWSSTTTFGYTRQSAVAVNTGDLDTYSGNQRFGYSFSSSWEAFANYSYLAQNGTSATPNQNYHRNLISFGISYTLSPAVRY
jgi:hypothetical protein